MIKENKPEVLSPAGNLDCALAAFAAGADAVYLGLKNFSARMMAENFSSIDLAKIIGLAKKHQKKVYVTMNSMLKQNEQIQAMRYIKRLMLDAEPDAFIIQDLALLPIIKESGFSGEIHGSTLLNCSDSEGLNIAKSSGFSRIVLPRELTRQEISLLNDKCPEGMGLEVFVHGALCFCVSGRCWWSSYMGGKSGLRGRCVQPCRRVYKQKNKEGRFFSSLDLAFASDVYYLTKLNNVKSWKIEGRRKSPHYVYHVTSAYTLLRDHGDDKNARKEAAKLLELSLGRLSSKSFFAIGASSGDANKGSKKSALGVQPKDGNTASGAFCGKIVQDEKGAFCLQARLTMFPQDYVRVGYEDELGHSLVRISKGCKPGELIALHGLNRGVKSGLSAFIIDRKEPSLQKLLAQWRLELPEVLPKDEALVEGLDSIKLSTYKTAKAGNIKTYSVLVKSSIGKGKDSKIGIGRGVIQGLWLSPKALQSVSRTLFSRISWWLPPVIWPDEQDLWAKLINQLARDGAKQIVCNSPWQIGYIKRNNIEAIAGPFCNLANPRALVAAKDMGFDAAYVSAELPSKELLSLPKESPLPLGIVVSGYFPMGISRFNMGHLKQGEVINSPKKESFWIKTYGQNTWIYPSWPIDITENINNLQKAGYAFFANLDEHPPTADERQRQGLFNWNNQLL